MQELNGITILDRDEFIAQWPQSLFVMQVSFAKIGWGLALSSHPSPDRDGTAIFDCAIMRVFVKEGDDTPQVQGLSAMSTDPLTAVVEAIGRWAEQEAAGWDEDGEQGDTTTTVIMKKREQRIENPTRH